jgi:diguanylate cyclase (GGDEF)-like protein
MFAPSVAVTVLSVAVLVGALFYVTNSANLSARNHEQAIVANGVNVLIADIAENAASVTASHAGVGAHFHPKPDLNWLHVKIGAPLHRAYGFEFAFALDAEDIARYAMRDGDLAGDDAYAAFAPAAAPLVDSVRRLEAAPHPLEQADEEIYDAPIQASAVARVGGRVYVLTASLVQSAPPGVTAVRAPIVVTAEALDEGFLNSLSNYFLLDNLSLGGARLGDDPKKAQIALTDAVGESVATLQWWPETPGAALLRNVLPPVLVLVLGLGVLGWALHQRGRRAAHKLIASEARATHLAYHDALTGLPNRLLLSDRLGRAVADLRRRKTPFAVHCVDLDRFKEVNDTFGHQAGDEVIQMAAQKISSACRQADTVARLGGDEFAVIQIGADLDGAATLAERLVALLAEPLELSVGRVYIGGSVGVSLLTDGLIEAQECLRQADLALYRVKQSGRGGFCFFEQEMDATVRFRRALQTDLRDAIERDQLYLVYQPQVNGRGRTVGVEALVRWDHPTRGPLSPTVFVPIAEESGLIDALGFFTLRRAFEDSKRWPGLKVAVNISATQLRMKDFAGKLSDAVAAAHVDPACFELEITEGVLLGDDPQTHETLRRIRTMGFALALDDFGTGYSSLSYLQRYPIDKIKIDRSFVTNLGIDLEADAVVAAIVRLARALHLDVIAEGVETTVQRTRLARAGCPDVQGFLFGKPSSVEAIDALVAAERLAADRLAAG